MKNINMKKSIWYYLISFIGFVVFVCSIIPLVDSSINFNYRNEFYGYDFLQEDENGNKKFTDTELFRNMYISDIEGLASYMAVKSQIETNGKLDEKKPIDIIPYNFRKDRDGVPENLQNFHMVYHLADLLDWGNAGINYEVTRTDDGDTYSYIEDGREYLINHSGDAEEEPGANNPEELMDSEAVRDGGDKLIESYKMADGKSIYDLELPEGVSYEQLQQYLVNAVYDLEYNYSVYDRYQSVYGSEMNIKYLLVKSDGKVVFTNLQMDKTHDIKDYKKAICALDRSFSFAYGDNELKLDNLQDWDSFYSQRIRYAFKDFGYLYDKDATLYVGFLSRDDELLGTRVSDDVYVKAQANVIKIQNSMMTLLILAGIGLVVALIFLVLAVCFTEKREKDQLRGFDRWYTEIAAAFAILVELALLGVALEIVGELASEIIRAHNLLINKETFFAGIVGMSIVMYGLFLVFLASLVRRIKAKTLWSNAICIILCKKVGGFFVKSIRGMLHSENALFRFGIPFAVMVLGGAFVFVIEWPTVLKLLALLLLCVAITVYNYKKYENLKILMNGLNQICEGDVTYQIKTEGLKGDTLAMANHINAIGNGIEKAVNQSMKDERMKADLITNVSHDIKTPLTSIINYVDLLKKENINHPKAQEYIKVLDEKSQRLKQLTLDLVEASKISSGNIEVQPVEMDMKQLLEQVLAEYEDKLSERELTVITSYPEDKSALKIKADPRHMWRVMDNLLGNVRKYALKGSRVYIDMEKTDTTLRLVMKNISEMPLNIDADELTQRFVRGDVSRSTEGSGLGLSIAKNLTQVQGGNFDIYLDGDLFKVTIEFAVFS